MKRFKMFITVNLLVLIFIIVVLVISFLDGYFGDRVDLYLEQHLKLMSEEKIARVVNEYVATELKNEEIITWQDNGENSQIEIKTSAINQILTAVTEAMIESIKKSEQEVEFKLPVGIILSETMFNFGPSFNIEAYPVGTVDCDIATSVTEFGINNSIFRLDIVVAVDYIVLVPLSNRHIISSNKVPLIIQLIQGKTPIVYSSGS